MAEELPSEIDEASMSAALVEAGLLDPDAARRALAAAAQAGTGLARTLLELGLAPEDRLYRALADQVSLPFLEAEALAAADVGGLAARLSLGPAFLARVGIVPVAEDEGGVTFATGDLGAGDALRGVAYHLKRRARTAIATPSAVRAAIEGIGAAPSAAAPPAAAADIDVERLRASANDGPIVTLVNELIAAAAEARASDIHVEAAETELRVRLRVDGALRTLRTIPDADRAAVASRLKVMADLNISERRRPQDGRAQVAVRGRAIDLRVSTLPTQFGESIVLRLLDRQRVALDWPALGFEPARVAAIEAIVRRPHGLFLVAGPTGSGKTTTLYTALSRINSEDRKVVTVEDPIEYALAGVNQVQVEPRIEMTFARALRAILRQDPDVVMVGEIRDQETAEIAVRAALVGRLVLSTIHTNDAVSAIDRLHDLGVPRYLIAATLRGVLSQRLVRRLCPSCGGDGCTACARTGRAGRLVVCELLATDAALGEAIASGTQGRALLALAAGRGFVTLDREGENLVRQGVVDRRDLGSVLED